MRATLLEEGWGVGRRGKGERRWGGEERECTFFCCCRYLPVDFWTVVCSHVYLDEDGLPCAVPYSFKHSLRLVDDAEEFRVSLSRALQCNCNSKSSQGLFPHGTTRCLCLLLQDTVLREISSFNLDIPEGGLDGLVQVMACKEVCLPTASPLCEGAVTGLPAPSRSLAGEMGLDTWCCF